MTHTVRLITGEIGTVQVKMKPHELIGRPVLAMVLNDGVEYYVGGVVAHVYEQTELAL